MRTTRSAGPPLIVRSAVFGTALCLLAGCSGSSKPQAAAPVTSSPARRRARRPSRPTRRLPPPSTSARPTPSVATSISIPPNLCAATDRAQNTADAYMGALSAGDEKEAVACVYGNSVPLSAHPLAAGAPARDRRLPAGDGRPGRPHPVRLPRQRAGDQGHRDQPARNAILGHRRHGAQADERAPVIGLLCAAALLLAAAGAGKLIRPDRLDADRRPAARC